MFLIASYSPNISRKYAADLLQVVDVEERNLLLHQKVEVRLEAVVCWAHMHYPAKKSW